MTQLNIYDFLDEPMDALLQHQHYTSNESHLHNLAVVIDDLLTKHPQLKDLIND